MTGILLTNENFKKFSKNLNKIKPEIALSQAQEELANIFGFKNLFQAKKEIEKFPFYINNDNFDYFSSRLNLNIDSSKVNDSFAFIIGYVNYNIYQLNLFCDEFIKNLENFYETENRFYNYVVFKKTDKCLMLHMSSSIEINRVFNCISNI